MNIAGRVIGPGYQTFIVAEIGINHNGSVEDAKKLIDVVYIAGADAIKLQKRTVEAVYSEEELARPRESPFGKTNGDLKRGLEFDGSQYAEINDYCKGKGIIWFASPWDARSVDFLEQFDIPVFKVASACLTDFELLEKIATTEKPVIMSTGMSSQEEIAAADCIFQGQDLALLVCTSTYPCALENLNLNRIETMIHHSPWRVIGYSGHEVGLYTTLCAVAMGACIVERHITLDRASWGSDQAASIEPGGFIKLCSEIRDFEAARGIGTIGMIESEKAVKEKLRRVG
jgi:N-acetylneuraminate synthase